MKKGFCIYYMSHRGIGKIVKESNDWKKQDKEMKKGKYDIYCHGCGPDMKTATKKYNLDMEKKKKEAKLLREQRKKVRNSKASKKKKNPKRKKTKKNNNLFGNWLSNLF